MRARFGLLGAPRDHRVDEARDNVIDVPGDADARGDRLGGADAVDVARDGRGWVEDCVVAQRRFFGPDPVGVATAERVVSERAGSALRVVDHGDLEQRTVRDDVFGDLADEGDVVDHLRGDTASDVADDDRVAEAEARTCAGSTRGSRHVMTNRPRLGNTTAPWWPSAAAKARLRSNAGSIFDVVIVVLLCG
jgi:hypothetical protein